MDRFVLRSQISFLKKEIAAETNESLRRSLDSELLTAQRNLALLDAESRGAVLFRASWSFKRVRERRLTTRFHHVFEASPHPYVVIDPRPGLHVVDVNEAWTKVTGADRDRVAGERLFDLYPDNPDDPKADGIKNAYTCLQLAAVTGKPQTLEVQHYDIKTASGEFVTRYWHSIHSPLYDRQKRLAYLIVQIEDITAYIAAP